MQNFFFNQLPLEKNPPKLKTGLEGITGDNNIRHNSAFYMVDEYILLRKKQQTMITHKFIPCPFFDNFAMIHTDNLIIFF